MKTKIDTIVQYIKSFGNKGKLPSVTEPLRSYYEPYMEEAFKWCIDNDTEDTRRNGFPFFQRHFVVDIVGHFIFNNRGLIYVERQIVVKPDNINTLTYKSVGECWSWSKNSSHAYCSDFGLLDRDTVTVTLCGYVHPSSVDWVETIYTNSYRMAREREIRMNDGAMVEMSYIKIFGRRVNLGGYYLINASADKYSHSNPESEYYKTVNHIDEQLISHIVKQVILEKIY